MKKKIGLGIITCKRPDGLRNLLESLVALDVPKDATCVILIAENDTGPSVDPVLDDLGGKLPFEMVYELEERRGIPFARNKVLDMALGHDCDYLTFVDDDEIVANDWLVRLYDGLVSRDLDLVGGPVLYAPLPGEKLTLQNRSVMAEIQRFGQQGQVQRAGIVGTDAEPDMPIFTNNWMIRLARQRQLGTRFDEALRYTGGSDSKYHSDFKAAGGRSGWVPDALVTEHWPRNRLTWRYRYKRSSDQEVNRRLRSRRGLGKGAALVAMLRHAIRASAFLVTSPFTPHFGNAARAAAALGKGAGRLRAAFGGRSDLYDPDTAA